MFSKSGSRAHLWFVSLSLRTWVFDIALICHLQQANNPSLMLTNGCSRVHHRVPTRPCFPKNQGFLPVYSFRLGRTTFLGAPQQNSSKSHSPGLDHMLMGTNPWQEACGRHPVCLRLILTERSWLAPLGKAGTHSRTQNSVEAPE